MHRALIACPASFGMINEIEVIRPRYPTCKTTAAQEASALGLQPVERPLPPAQSLSLGAIFTMCLMEI
jgi:hypothetical protein